MKDGDTSVILKNVSINDAGSYHCRIIFANTGGDVTELRNLTVTGSGGAAGDKDEGKTVEVTKDGGDEDEGNKDVNVGLVADGSFVPHWTDLTFYESLKTLWGLLSWLVRSSAWSRSSSPVCGSSLPDLCWK
ncbi:hypothetical protein Q5P01_000234 [Channa striata]|uniref:Uncharacterized protein n=1 Tax=Channa striata TaxID=64152 RepID=A0AA88IGK0_CHASR|nr:hypothetical protein Q5P01_000234 [Channa striata]